MAATEIWAIVQHCLSKRLQNPYPKKSYKAINMNHHQRRGLRRGFTIVRLTLFQIIAFIYLSINRYKIEIYSRSGFEKPSIWKLKNNNSWLQWHEMIRNIVGGVSCYYTQRIYIITCDAVFCSVVKILNSWWFYKFLSNCY